MGKEVLEFKKIKEEAKEKLPENVKIIETPEARFRIIYGSHIKAQRLEELGNADALVLEGGYDYTNKENAEKIMEEWKKDKQYALIIERARKQNKPVFLMDISKADAVGLMQLGLKAVETATGFGLLYSLGKDIVKREKMTRREFLKKTSKGLAGLYFFTQSAEVISSFGKTDEKSKRRAVFRFIKDLNEEIHPEADAIVYTLRNNLMAQKLNTIAERLRQAKKEKPEISLVVGALHTGIEKALQKQDPERVALIDKLLRVPGLGKARDRIATIARLDFDREQNKWVAEIFKDPHLAPLEKK